MLQLARFNPSCRERQRARNETLPSKRPPPPLLLLPVLQMMQDVVAQQGNPSLLVLMQPRTALPPMLASHYLACGPARGGLRRAQPTGMAARTAPRLPQIGPGLETRLPSLLRGARLPSLLPAVSPAQTAAKVPVRPRTR